MIANLISPRSLISSEEGGDVLPSVAEEMSVLPLCCGGDSPCSRAPFSVIRSNSFNSPWYFSCFSMVLIKFLIRGVERTVDVERRRRAAGREGAMGEPHRVFCWTRGISVRRK